MERSITDILKNAYEDLSGYWGTVILAWLILFLISGALSCFSLITTGPLLLGLSGLCLNVVRNREVRLEQLFDGFQNFGNSLATYLLMMLACGIGFLFFVIPGIILSLMFSMTFFIMVDEKDISPVDALKKSMSLMDGHKLDLFLLVLIFIVLGFLCIFTLGIGFFFLMPLYYVTMAKFYETIKGDAISEVRMDGEALDSDFV